MKSIHKTKHCVHHRLGQRAVLKFAKYTGATAIGKNEQILHKYKYMNKLTLFTFV